MGKAKLIGIIVGAAIATVLVAGILGYSTALKDQTPIQQQTITSSPTSLPTTTITTESKPIDKTATLDNLTFNLIDVKSTSTISSGNLVKTADGRYAIVKITITNNDNVSRNIQYYDFKLVDSNNREFAITDQNWMYVNGLQDSSINPGLQKTVQVPFDIPKNSEVYTLKVSSDNSGFIFHDLTQLNL